jgi:hypothetical protein
MNIKTRHIGSITGFAACILLITCAPIKSPYEQYENAQIDLVFDEPIKERDYITGDTLKLGIALYLPDLIDSLRIRMTPSLDTGIVPDSQHQSREYDTLRICHILTRPDSIRIELDAILGNGETIQRYGYIYVNGIPVPDPELASKDAAGVTLSWNRIAVADRYRVYRHVSASVDSAQLLAEMSDTMYTDAISKAHYYRVAAVRGVVESGMSEALQLSPRGEITIPPPTRN